MGRLAAGALLALLVCVAGCGRGERSRPGAGTGDRFLGWDAHRLANGQAVAMVVPAVARVMAFGRNAGANVFWQNPDLQGKPADLTDGPWRNFGGAKIWAAPQQAWGWPPDRLMDQGPCSIIGNATPMGVTLEGAVSPKMGLRLDRKMKLRPDEPVMDLTYTMRATGKEPAEWGIWSILQLKPGGIIMLPVPKGTHLWDDAEGGHLGMWQRDGDLLSMTHTGVEMKVFTISPEGWVAYAVDDTLLVLSFKGDATARYPVEEGSAEVYCGGDYVELEHVGPLVSLKRGASTKLKESWHLLRLEPGERDPVTMAARIRAYLAAD